MKSQANGETNMSLAQLHSGLGLGSDVTRKHSGERTQLFETSGIDETWVELQQVRVVVGHLGNRVRLSAPALGVVEEGDCFDKAWALFLERVRERPDNAWLTFDVGLTRKDEVAKGLDAPEDETWCEPASGQGL
jgi:hypothetical protein